MAASTRLLIVPRWSGRPDDDWYPWLQRELAQPPADRTARVDVAEMPDPDLPVIGPWVRRLASLVGTSEQAAHTILVGHSVGCQALIRYLATAPPNHVAGVLLVAAWWAVDQPWPAIQPWIETPIDLPRVRAAAPYFRVLLSSDDPFTSDQAANGCEWEEQLDAEVTVVPGAGHFNGRQEPAVLRAVEQMVIGPSRQSH